MTIELTPQARDLLSRQDQVATTMQLRAAGLTKTAVHWNAGRHWRLLLPRVVIVSRDSPTDRQRLIAALLWAGPKAYLANATAAVHHGITSAVRHDGIVDLLTPHPCSTRRKGFAQVTRTELEDHDVRVIGPIRVASPAHAAIGAALNAGRPSDREAILIEAVQKRIATVDDLADWAYRLRPRDTFRLEPALQAAASGAWSSPEATLLGLVSTSPVLAEPWLNPSLRGPDGSALVTPDLWFDELAVAVMVHSHRHHSQGEDWDSTVDRDAELSSLGVVVVGVTPGRLRRDPEAVLLRIEAACRTAEQRPRPPVTARPQQEPVTALLTDAS